MDAGTQLTCSFCSLSVTSYHSWLSHIRLVHCHEPGFFISCVFEGCCKTYNNFSSFNSHVYRHHRDKVCQSAPSTGQAESETSNSNSGTTSYAGTAPTRQDFDDNAVLDCSSGMTLPNVTQMEIAEILGDAEGQQKRKCDHFLLGLKENFCVSQKALDKVVTGYETLLNFSALRIQASINTYCQPTALMLPFYLDLRSFLKICPIPSPVGHQLTSKCSTTKITLD